MKKYLVRLIVTLSLMLPIVAQAHIIEVKNNTNYNLQVNLVYNKCMHYTPDNQSQLLHPQEEYVINTSYAHRPDCDSVRDVLNFNVTLQDYMGTHRLGYLTFDHMNNPHQHFAWLGNGEALAYDDDIKVFGHNRNQVVWNFIQSVSPNSNPNPSFYLNAWIPQEPSLRDSDNN